MERRRCEARNSFQSHLHQILQQGWSGLLASRFVTLGGVSTFLMIGLDPAALQKIVWERTSCESWANSWSGWGPSYCFFPYFMLWISPGERTMVPGVCRVQPPTRVSAAYPAVNEKAYPGVVHVYILPFYESMVPRWDPSMKNEKRWRGSEKERGISTNFKEAFGSNATHIACFNILCMCVIHKKLGVVW